MTKNPSLDSTAVANAIRAFQPATALRQSAAPSMNLAQLPAGIEASHAVLALPPVAVALLEKAAEALVMALAQRIGERLGEAGGNLVDRLIGALFGPSVDYQDQIISRLDQIQATLNTLINFLTNDLVKILDASIDLGFARNSAATIHTLASSDFKQAAQLLDSATADGTTNPAIEFEVYKIARDASSLALTTVSRPEYGILFFGSAIEAVIVLLAAAKRLCSDPMSIYTKSIAGYARDLRKACEPFVDSANPRSFIGRYTPIQQRVTAFTELVGTNCLGGADFFAGWTPLGIDGAGNYAVRPTTFRLTGWNDTLRTSQRTATNRPPVTILSGQEPTPELVYSAMRNTYPPHDNFPICSWWRPMAYTWSSFDAEAHGEIDRNWAFAKLDGPPLAEKLKSMNDSVLKMLEACDYLIQVLDPAP